MKRSSLLLVLGLVGVAGLGLAISKVVGPRNSCGSGCESSPPATALAPAKAVARAPVQLEAVGQVQLEAVVPAQPEAAGAVKLELEQAAVPQRTDKALPSSVATRVQQSPQVRITPAEVMRHGSTDAPSRLRMLAIQRQSQPAGLRMRNEGLAYAHMTPEELNGSQDPAVAARQIRDGRLATNAAAAANPKLYNKQPIQPSSPK